MSGKWATGSDKKRAAKLAEEQGIGKNEAIRIILKRKGKDLPLQYKKETKHNSRQKRRRRATCERKQPYKTFVSASVARIKIINSKNLTEEQARKLEIYVCDICKNFHVGNSKGSPTEPQGEPHA
jgi:hypothetical protein